MSTEPTGRAVTRVSSRAAGEAQLDKEKRQVAAAIRRELAKALDPLPAELAHHQAEIASEEACLVAAAAIARWHQLRLAGKDRHECAQEAALAGAQRWGVAVAPVVQALAAALTKLQ